MTARFHRELFALREFQGVLPLLLLLRIGNLDKVAVGTWPPCGQTACGREGWAAEAGEEGAEVGEEEGGRSDDDAVAGAGGGACSRLTADVAVAAPGGRKLRKTGRGVTG